MPIWGMQMQRRLISVRLLGSLTLIFLLFGLLIASPALAATRYEQTDPSIVYTGVWTPSVLPGHSGGSVAYTTTQLGATATFTFSGTGVDWIAAKWYNRGIGEVQIDGGAWQPVDQYAAGIPGDTNTVLYQQVVHSVRGLTNGPHTLTVRLTSSHNPAAASPYLITIDAFDVFVEPPAVSSPASSPWSLLLAGVLGIGGVAVMAKSKRRPSA
jgi:hypothetical protein